MGRPRKYPLPEQSKEQAQPETQTPELMPLTAPEPEPPKEKQPPRGWLKLITPEGKKYLRTEDIVSFDEKIVVFREDDAIRRMAHDMTTDDIIDSINGGSKI